jgi:hypothetical protein
VIWELFQKDNTVDMVTTTITTTTTTTTHLLPQATSRTGGSLSPDAHVESSSGHRHSDGGSELD